MACCALVALASGSRADGLPPVPAPLADARTLTDQSRSELFLELQVNGLRTGKVVRVLERAGRLFVGAADLAAAGVDLGRAGVAPGQQWIGLGGLPGTAHTVDTHSLVLVLDVPADWLPAQRIGAGPAQHETPRADMGAMLSYDAHVSRNRLGSGFGASTQVGLWSEQRIFGGRGVFSNSGAWRDFGSLPALEALNGYRRFDTFWAWSDEASMLTFTLGDLVTGAQSWGSAVRLGGLKLGHDYRLRPDLITYPLPQYSGLASVPSTVELFVDGQRTGGGPVQPGPFSIDGIPMMNGAGEAMLVTTDALGRQTVLNLPFYVSSELLRRGLTDGSVSAGFIRRRYGLENASYGDAAASAVLRHGFTDRFTGELQVDATAVLQTFGVGAVYRVAQLGVVNASVSGSNWQDISGRQLSFGYRYARRGFNVGYRGVRRDQGFVDFSSVDADLALVGGRLRRSDIATASFAMGRQGSIGVGYFDVRAADASRTRLATLSYSVPLPGRSLLHLSASRDLQRGGQTLLAQLSVPLGMQESVNTVVSRDRQGRQAAQVNYSRTVPMEGGVGWQLGYTLRPGGDDHRHASLVWSHRHAQVQVGSYGGGGARTDWANLRGSVVWLGGRAFATRQVSDAFVVVSTDGVAGVPVRYENQLIGHTDASGHLLVPSVPSYYSARYEIDPLALPSGMKIPVVEQRVQVRRRSGALLDFPMQPSGAALIALVDASGAPLALGTRVTHEGGGGEAYVGHDGLVYLEELGERNLLVVERADAPACRVAFEMAPGAELARIGPLRCE